MTTLPDGQGDEQFVREHWDNEALLVTGIIPSQEWAFADPWPNLRAYTEARLEEIRQVEEEIAWLEDCPSHGNEAEQQRVLRSRQAALAELKRGLKEKPAACEQRCRELEGKR